ncbi:hypothetical protein BU16DRAFT_556222 [Lophium mytilinum]|uniref:Uncharacterized protein n=1 Tax=Lophium mytilinum TaxID=390894 RepID=A0A6A6RB21_9PEZI|nr:hypothetical protein BU16DRAFT_556222 [Lophium mytilinum]
MVVAHNPTGLKAARLTVPLASLPQPVLSWQRRDAGCGGGGCYGGGLFQQTSGALAISRLTATPCQALRALAGRYIERSQGYAARTGIAPPPAVSTPASIDDMACPLANAPASIGAQHIWTSAFNVPASAHCASHSPCRTVPHTPLHRIPPPSPARASHASGHVCAFVMERLAQAAAAEG